MHSSDDTLDGFGEHFLGLLKKGGDSGDSGDKSQKSLQDSDLSVSTCQQEVSPLMPEWRQKLAEGVATQAQVATGPETGGDKETPAAQSLLSTVATVSTVSTDFEDGRGLSGSLGVPENDTNVIYAEDACIERYSKPPQGPFAKVFAVLKARCPDYVDEDRWHQAIDDGERFLEAWGDQAAALGWTSRDLFGLHTPPTNPHPSYSRLSRYDATGVVWLLAPTGSATRINVVVALTETTASIRHPSGSITVYRKENKPGYGPLGDSLDDFKP